MISLTLHSAKNANENMDLNRILSKGEISNFSRDSMRVVRPDIVIGSRLSAEGCSLDIPSNVFVTKKEEPGSPSW